MSQTYESPSWMVPFENQMPCLGAQYNRLMAEPKLMEPRLLH